MAETGFAGIPNSSLGRARMARARRNPIPLRSRQAALMIPCTCNVQKSSNPVGDPNPCFVAVAAERSQAVDRSLRWG